MDLYNRNSRKRSPKYSSYLHLNFSTWNFNRRIYFGLVLSGLLFLILFLKWGWNFSNKADQMCFQNEHQSSTGPTSNQTRQVLPLNVLPTHYDLTLKANLEDFTLSGQVVISLNILSPTSQISLNSKDLIISSGLLKVSEALSLTPTKIDSDNASEVTTFSFQDLLPVSTTCKLSIDFVGYINDKLAGFYKSTYLDKNNETKYMAVTQFEATDARRAFPCWDEPNKKATFSVTLIVDQKYTALSNMESKEDPLPDSTYKKVVFDKSPIMSSYLVAFVVGEMEYIEAFTKKDKVRIRVYTPKGGFIDQGKYALSVGVDTLDYYTEYFQLSYPLPKLDMVAIPDFGSGAMENWGLVTYRTTLLLFDEKSSTLSTKKTVASVVAHELAHQWFGNLVTMEWWSDLWLNEGFATWVSYLACNYLHPEWNVWTEFLGLERNRALCSDSLESSHAIEVQVDKLSEINQVFDSISYSKGASIIHMLESYLGPEIFKQGLGNYLKEFSYKNAVTSDLWNALEKSSGKPVEKIMKGWTSQKGFPIIRVQESFDNDKGLVLQVQQSKFVVDAVQQENTASSGSLWRVPLNVIVYSSEKLAWYNEILSEKALELKISSLTEDSASKLFLESYESQRVRSQTKISNTTAASDETRKLSSSGFFKVNSLQKGFFYTQYSTQALDNLGKAVYNGHLALVDKLGLVGENFSLGFQGYYSMDVALEFLKYLKNERDYFICYEIHGGLYQLLAHFLGEPESSILGIKKLILSVFKPIVRELGWEFPEQEDHGVSLLRSLSIKICGIAADEEVILEAKKRFKEFLGGNEASVHPNLRSSVFFINVRYGSEEDYNSVLKIYKDSKVADQKVIALAALTATYDLALIKKTLDMSISSDVKPQDIIYVFRPFQENKVGARMAWNFVKEHWDEIYNKYNRGSLSLLESIVRSTTTQLNQRADIKDVQEFFSTKEISSINRAVEQSLEKIKINVEFLERERTNIENWLSKNAVNI